MHEYSVERRFGNILYEAELLTSQHGGIHEMHGALGALDMFSDKPEWMTPDGLAYCEALLAKMRVAALNGVYPKRTDPVSIALEEAADKFFGGKNAG